MAGPALPYDPIERARQNWVRLGWEPASEGMAVVTSVMRIQQVLLARAEAALRPFGITFARYEVLMILTFSRTGALPVGKIGQRLQVHPASVTNAVQRLEADGLVKRRPNDSDRRGVLAAITPTGRERAEAATLALNDTVFSQLEISPADQRRLIEISRRWRGQLGDFAS